MRGKTSSTQNKKERGEIDEDSGETIGNLGEFTKAVRNKKNM